MLFPTFEFLTFFTFVLIFNWLLKRWPLIWRLFLLGSSYYFYSVWDFRFLLILIFVSLINFLTGLLIYKFSKIKRKLIFVLSIIFNLFILGIFKYYDFFRISFVSFCAKFGFFFTLPLLEIILPVGLSFYIFRVISYNIDIYLEKIRPTLLFLDFFIYVSFFPQLLAGPIARAKDFLSQLKNGGAKRIENFYYYITLIILGLFKKLVISSYLVLTLTDDVFAVPENHSPFAILLTIFSYSIVIYFDFSGYSDMAIGFAGLMGFKSPINFDFPYLASNLREFWRKWHVSLSNWVRDYIYIPLGGGRKGRPRKYFNLMIAMFLMGLWHGPAFHFIFWGALHGLGLILVHFYHDLKKLKFSYCSRINRFFSSFLTFNFVSFTWIFFRSNNVESAFKFIKALFNFEKELEPFKIYILLLIICGFLLIFFEKKIIKKLITLQQKLPPLFLFLFIIFAIILIFKMGPDVIPPFIYFGF